MTRVKVIMHLNYNFSNIFVILTDRSWQTSRVCQSTRSHAHTCTIHI